MESSYPYKLLLVEDEKAIRENYVTYLKMLFSEVFEAEDGEKAYEIYKSKKPDILIIDINIPKLNGLELLEKIRENDHTTKAIILTAYTDKSFLLKATSLKLTKYLVKPVNRKELNETLELTVNELLKYNITTLKRIELVDNYSWDLEIKELMKHNTIVNLTNKEKVLLELLLSHKNRVFTYDEIYNYVWDFDEDITLNGLKNIIKRIRKKLPDNIIQNIFNEGYKINY
ncbi:response regulator [Poseidonibacter sp. 1_MG-2023]|uniref:response regulator transcription factor n=1 Tax=Poseidonibacter TaxID=2321187 RepID=UPI001E368031|nr:MULTISPECIES: response regulator [Poseidonibacter]MDO6827344.1 response regulator [Poseidonibacter sp. 1_MG-2023]